jgi:hypothetical protein
VGVGCWGGRLGVQEHQTKQVSTVIILGWGGRGCGAARAQVPAAAGVTAAAAAAAAAASAACVDDRSIISSSSSVLPLPPPPVRACVRACGRCYSLSDASDGVLDCVYLCVCVCVCVWNAAAVAHLVLRACVRQAWQAWRVCTTPAPSPHLLISNASESRKSARPSWGLGGVGLLDPTP